MKSTWSACSFLLLTMAAVSRGRNAADYFQKARFQYSPSRPEDALVLFMANVPPAICEPANSYDTHAESHWDNHFRLGLPHHYSHYRCSFEGNSTALTNLKLIEDILSLRSVDGRWTRVFRDDKMYCTTNSQLPDEYFHFKVQRPHEDHVVKCRLLTDGGRLHLRFSGYPTITCDIGNEAGGYHFTLPGIDDPFTCTFRVYSEFPLGDTHTEERLYQALIGGLPARVDGARPCLLCSRHAASNGTALFQPQLTNGDTFDCTFPDAVPRCRPPSQHTPQD